MPTPPLTSQKKKPVLVVSKDPFLRMILSRYLAKKGFLVSKAGTRDEALELSKTRKGEWHALVADDHPEGLAARDLFQAMNDGSARFSRTVVMTPDKRPRRGLSRFRHVTGHAITLPKPVEPRALIEALTGPRRRGAATTTSSAQRSP